MEQFLLVDLTCDYKEKKSYKELKNRLVELVVTDAIESGYNTNDKDILKNDVLILSKLAKEDFVSLDYIKKELEGFSYKVIDLLDLQRDLEDIKQYYSDKGQYYSDNGQYIGDIPKKIDEIIKGLNE